MKKLFMVFLIVSLASGCGGMAVNRLVHTGEKDAFVQIIINDKEIKEQYGSKLIDRLKEVFSHSFKNVSVRTGYDNPKVGELLVIPQKVELSISELKGGSVKARAYSTIKVLTNSDYRLYTVFGEGKYELSIVEQIGLIPAMMAGGIVGTFVGNIESGAKAPTTLWNSAPANRALESMAIDLHNKIASTSDFKTYTESVKMLKTAPANLNMSLKFTDTHSYFPNNTIDAGEESLIVVTITNNGKGTAFEVKLDMDVDYKNINFEKAIIVGNIQPDESKEVKINVKAGLDLEDGKVPFSITCSEKLRYDVKKVVLDVPASNQLSKGIDNIVAKITSTMKQNGWKRVAIAEFKSGGKYSDLERYLMEEVTTRISHSKEFTVVEKYLFNQAVTELRINLSDLVSPVNAKRFGQLTGADAILVGTTIDLMGKVRIGTRLIDIETGKIYELIREEIMKDENILKLIKAK